MKNFSTSLLAFVCFIVASCLNLTVKAQTCNTNTPVSYTITETSPGEIYIPDASSRPWKGGDTLKIPAKTYSLIEISNFSGDPCKKIVIINSGGQVVTNTWRMRNDSRYFKITGTGKSGIDFGIKINGGMMAISLAHHFEVDHVEATGGSLGFYFKSVPDLATPKSIYTTGSSSNYVMSDIYIHHNYMHDIHGEGMYIGHTGPNGDQEGTGLIPIRLDNVEIAYNTVTRVDWDGIQLSNARTNAKIHDNIVWNFGLINKGSQQAGIILGGNTTGEIYNNTVSKGTGTGIQVFGYGTIRIYNNSVDSTGNDLTSIGQESVYCNDNITTPESNPKQQVFFNNNIIRNPMPKGAVRVTWYNNNSLPASLINNQYYIPNAAADWMFWHVVANPPGSIKTNNVLIGSVIPPVINIVPVANAGADKTITLPLNSISLTGSGTDQDGTISSYTWTKISGPAAVIATAANAATIITGMLQGDYVFQLKVTDNSGATATDDIRITVNPVIIPVPPVIGGPAKSINVNLTNATVFNNSQWNNWNTTSGLSTAKFLFSDATASNVSAVLSDQPLIADNGISYATNASVVPGEVLRFNSASTTNRTLTIKGLDPTKKYNASLYGSRANNGNKTIFTIGAIKDTISTDNNVSDVAKFTSVLPDNSGNIIITISRLGTWNYLAGFTITDAALSTPGNQLPVVNAGADKTITLPVNSLSLTASASDPDGSVVSYAWTKVSGPAVTISGASGAVVSVNNMSEGSYSFQLMVTDNSGGTASDLVTVVVNASGVPESITKIINVNLNNGTALNNNQWNNWNVNSSLSSTKFNYADATLSNISAVINSQAMVVDNGSTYASAATLIPGAVLRFNSASTSTRMITLKGLIPSKKYDLRFYGSRASNGNKTIFECGNKMDTLNTDNNINDIANLYDVVADNAGNALITISRIGTWNYIAGLSIIEQSALAMKGTSPEIINSAALNNDSTVFVSPVFIGVFKTEIRDHVAGAYSISIVDKDGKVVMIKSGIKTTDDITELLNTRSLINGQYVAKITTITSTKDFNVTKKIIATNY